MRPCTQYGSVIKIKGTLFELVTRYFFYEPQRRSQNKKALYWHHCYAEELAKRFRSFRNVEKEHMDTFLTTPRDNGCVFSTVIPKKYRISTHYRVLDKERKIKNPNLYHYESTRKD